MISYTKTLDKVFNNKYIVNVERFLKNRRRDSMNYKIVSDSSSNLYEIEGINYASVPLKIVTQEKEYIDKEGLDIHQMIEELKVVKGKTGTACPSAGEWFEAFGDSDAVFAISITSKLSGCYNAAMVAKSQFEEMYPEKKIHIFDSLSTGAEIELIIRKMIELIQQEKSFEEIVDTINDYMKHTHLLFVLESVHNLASNGRVSPVLAKSASVFGVRVVAKASDVGDLEPFGIVRGAKKALKRLYEEILKKGYQGHKMIICHTENESGAEQLKEMLLEKYPQADIQINEDKGLCSYYLEPGGIMAGFEDQDYK